MHWTIHGRGGWKAARIPVILSTLALCAISAAPAAASATPDSPAPEPPASQASHNWASFHRTADLQGWAASSPVTTANASGLGVRWAADLYGAAVGSPVEAYNATLKEPLAYAGTLNGDLLAVSMATGQVVWSVYLGSEIRTSPIVAGGAVWVATYNSPRMYKVNAATGAVACSVASTQTIEGTPVAATPPGGVPSVYFGANDSVASGPVYALSQRDCAVEWSFTGYLQTAGSWDPLGYAVDAKGEPLVLLGTSDPDSAVYAIDAVTGQRVWYYSVANPPPHNYDVGSGVVTTAPGVNGFADGMAYVESKRGIMYALDLTTGARVWSADYSREIGSLGRNISTPALSGQNLVLGDANGLVDLNPLTGKVVWHNDDPADIGVDSSPAIAGPSGSQVVAYGDLSGGFEVDSLATGAQLYHYQAAQYIAASPAVSGGNILITSADGFLYDFAAGGGNEATPPTAVVSSPADSSRVANPNGTLTVAGSAAGQAGVARVVVAVQESGPSGQWWDAAAGAWVSGPVGNRASLASPGSGSSSWTFGYPVPASGGTYQVTAYTVSASGESSAPAQSGFTVLPSATSPRIRTGTRFVPPGGHTTVSGSGFGGSETVAIALAGTTIATAQTTSSGTLPSTVVTIPASTDFGLTSLTATGQQSGKTSTAGISVANAWSSVGYDASHLGFEPNDPDIYRSVAAGGGTYMNLSWAYASGSAVAAPPAVADGVAYVPDSTGQLTAVNVHDGAPLWTWSLPSRAALAGAPAVDTERGLVFAGAADGTLHAISRHSGKTVWTDHVGGDVTAPVFGGGHLYVASSTGTVEAVREATGKKLWASTLTHPVRTAPALDSTAKLVIVGESDGDVTALSATGPTAGSSEWTHATGSAVTTPPAIAGGTVYVGAGDSVYALREATGAAQWSYPTGGTIASSLTLTSTSIDGLLLTTGSADGHLYCIKATSGGLLWKQDIGSPVTGVASAFATYVFDTSNGIIGAGRITSSERLWERTTTAGAMTSPVIVDGTVYAGGQDANLYAYTTDGQPPS
jgi:outer membrane protein assembly factor BamB